MDAAWIAEALAVLEPRAAEAVEHASLNQWNEKNAPVLAGTSRPDVQGLFELEPWEKLVCHLPCPSGAGGSRTFKRDLNLLWLRRKPEGYTPRLGTFESNIGGS